MLLFHKVDTDVPILLFPKGDTDVPILLFPCAVIPHTDYNALWPQRGRRILSQGYAHVWKTMEEERVLRE